MSRGEASVQSKTTPRESGMRGGGGRGAQTRERGKTTTDQKDQKKERRTRDEGRGTTCQTWSEERRIKDA